VVNLPELSPDLEALATTLLPAGNTDYVLKYHNYSVVLHKERRFAMFSAANVDGGNRYALRRPTDNWRYDPRIPRAAQIGDFYYTKNRFDRGHLTRYEDLEFGSGVTEAVQSALDTCHWSNCTPQHAEFNERQSLWQGLETHILEDSIRNDIFKAQIFTGPILDEGDPVWSKYPEIQYPTRFWKIAAAVNSKDELFAAAFILDQSDVIARFGIEAVGEIPFTAFKTFQVPITEIEQLTGLTFTYEDTANAGVTRSLGDADPLRPGGAARARLARTRRWNRRSRPAGTRSRPAMSRSTMRCRSSARTRALGFEPSA
jgi:endonuclease G